MADDSQTNQISADEEVADEQSSLGSATNSEPEDGGSTTPNDGDYLPGEVVSIYPHPASGFQFLYWSGGFVGFDIPAVVVMNSNRSVTAHFGGGG